MMISQKKAPKRLVLSLACFAAFAVAPVMASESQNSDPSLQHGNIALDHPDLLLFTDRPGEGTADGYSDSENLIAEIPNEDTDDPALIALIARSQEVSPDRQFDFKSLIAEISDENAAKLVGGQDRRRIYVTALTPNQIMTSTITMAGSIVSSFFVLRLLVDPAMSIGKLFYDVLVCGAAVPLASSSFAQGQLSGMRVADVQYELGDGLISFVAGLFGGGMAGVCAWGSDNIDSKRHRQLVDESIKTAHGRLLNAKRNLLSRQTTPLGRKQLQDAWTDQDLDIYRRIVAIDELYTEALRSQVAIGVHFEQIREWGCRTLPHIRRTERCKRLESLIDLEQLERAATYQLAGDQFDELTVKLTEYASTRGANLRKAAEESIKKFKDLEKLRMQITYTLTPSEEKDEVRRLR